MQNRLSSLCLSLPVLATMTLVSLLGPGQAVAAKTLSESSLETEIRPENPKNPWDHIGRLHNEGLDLMAEKIVGDPSLEKISILSWQAAIETTESYFGDANVTELPLAGLADVAASRSTAYPMLDDEQAALLEDLVAVATQPRLTAQGKIEAVAAFEAEIEHFLDAERAMPILAAAAVGRYSTAYWHSQKAESSAWNLYPGTGAMEDLMKNIDPTVEADIRGAALGSIGGPKGTVLGGVITSGFSALGRIGDHFGWW